MLIYKDEVVTDASQQELLLNRSLFYGDGFFESMRCNSDGVAFIPYHQKRIFSAGAILKLEKSTLPDVNHISQLAKPFAEPGKNYRLRLTVFRNSAGFYAPEGHAANYFIQFSEVPPDNKELHVGIYTEQKKAPGPLSQIKSTSALLYVMAGIYGAEQGFNECLILNTDNRLAESTSSNVFIVFDGKIITPPLAEGCVDGVYRSYTIDRLQKSGIGILQIPVSIEMIHSASEIWLSNTIRGLRIVNKIEGKILAESIYKTVANLPD